MLIKYRERAGGTACFSNILLGLGLDDPLLDLFLFSLFQPTSDVLDPLIVCPVLKFFLGNIEYFPALMLEDLSR